MTARLLSNGSLLASLGFLIIFVLSTTTQLPAFAEGELTRSGKSEPEPVKLISVQQGSASTCLDARAPTLITVRKYYFKVGQTNLSSVIVNNIKLVSPDIEDSEALKLYAFADGSGSHNTNYEISRSRGLSVAKELLKYNQDLRVLLTVCGELGVSSSAFNDLQRYVRLDLP